MKTAAIFIAFLLCTIFSFAQITPSTPWTWMKGDNVVNQPGIYNTQAIANTTNKPGGRNYSTTWKDAAGNLWLFGGFGYSSTNMGYLNDLWKFDPITSNWIWFKGNNIANQYSNYGIKGVPNTANTPGAAYSASSWTDASGNLWLFGGFGYSNNSFGCLNALWKYNISSNEWTWVNGENSTDDGGRYGTQGTESANNKPGARYGSQTWVDESGNLWLFGGFGYSGINFGTLNDIWKYNPLTNMWTWIKGDDDINQTGVYGTKGISNINNTPGARYLSTSWKDKDNNLWLFGGYGYDENNTGDLNDLWKYNQHTNEWTWINGDKVMNEPGVYGSLGVPDTANKPGARSISNSWVNANGELWLLGGYGHVADNTGSLNDLWKYSPASNKWTWEKGDSTLDQMAIYGTQGIPDISNKAGARYGVQTWADATGNLWFFGGYGFDGNKSGSLNDLWKISNMQAVLPLHLLQFNGVLKDEKVLLQWESEQETGFSHFNIQRSFDGVQFTTIQITNGSGNSNRTDYSYTDTDLKDHQEQKVFYRLQLMDKDGTFTYSKILIFDKKQNATTAITTYPNPTTSSLTVSFDQKKAEKVSIIITDLKGMVVKKQEGMLIAGRTSVTIDVYGLAAATYILSVRNSEGTKLQKFIKQ